jgi:hypothetical protein
VATRVNFKTFLVSCSATLAIVSGASSAFAADLAAPVLAPIAPVVSPFNIFDGVEFHAQGEVGILGNSANPSNGANGDGYNFGHLYTDHANEPQLNQILMTLTKPIDPKATGYAFGFTAQGIYGSDMRSNHFLGIGTFFMGSDRNQLNVVQGFVAAHLPWLTAGGIDVKAGLFSSPQGVETLDPSTSPFYSHSYTYNYAVTFNHTGVLTTTHINPTFDLYLGVDTGNQTTFGVPGGDPNGTAAGFVGFGLNNLLDNKLTVLALSHIGPEQNFVADPNANKDLRYYNDAVFTYKINDDWTSTTELNYTKDEFGFGAGSVYEMSAVQYFGYALNKQVTLNVRGEVLRDAQNFFVSTPTDNSGIAKGEIGIPTLSSPTLFAPNGTQGTTYGGSTLGLTYKPDVPKPLALVMVRPEVRYDRILAGGPAYNNNGSGFGGSRNQFTFGGDLTVGF